MSGGSGGSRARLRRGPPVPALDPQQRVRGDAPDALLRFPVTSVPPRPTLLGFRGRRRIAAGEDLDVLVRAKALGPLKLNTCDGCATPPLRLVAPCHRPMELGASFVQETSVAEKESDNWLRELATSHSLLETFNTFSSETPLECAAGNFEHQGSVGNLLSIGNFEMQVIYVIAASFCPCENMANEGGGGPDWNGLLKWSLAHGGDGTTQLRALRLFQLMASAELAGKCSELSADGKQGKATDSNQSKATDGLNVSDRNETADSEGMLTYLADKVSNMEAEMHAMEEEYQKDLLVHKQENLGEMQDRQAEAVRVKHFDFLKSDPGKGHVHIVRSYHSSSTVHKPLKRRSYDDLLSSDGAPMVTLLSRRGHCDILYPK